MENETNETVSEEEQCNSPASVGQRDVQTADDKAECKPDSVVLEKGHVEECFKVDRKTLEKLIQATDHGGEGAVEFFDRIMSETGATILWPSKLKIGAKSKKDPFVKVRGLPEAVDMAKQLVCKDLDTKSDRVTLKMEVSHVEHSHIIGKGGANMKKVMKDTNCHIHFPDSNKESAHSEKSSQVSVAGTLQQVELARQSVRELAPIYLRVELPAQPDFKIVEYNSAVEEIMTTYNVKVHIKNSPYHVMQMVVLGTQMYADGLKLAVSKLVELFTGQLHSMLAVTLDLDIGPQHHQRLIGKGGSNVKKITDATETSIQFPNQRSRNSVMVFGTLDGVFAARKQLLGCLPLVLMYDLPNEKGKFIGSSVISQLMQQLDVYISVRPKPKQSTLSVIVKSLEQNSHCMYQTRDMLLQALSTSDTSIDKQNPPGFDSSVSWRVPTSSVSAYEDSFSAINHFSPSDNQRRRFGRSVPDIPEATLFSPGAQKRSGSLAFGQKLYQPPRAASQFLHYSMKKQQAAKAMQHKVTFEKPRVPQSDFCGVYFSSSMPGHIARDAFQNRKVAESSHLSPKGLLSLSKPDFVALGKPKTTRRGSTSQELSQPALTEDPYSDITDLLSLLKMLGLERYFEVFHKEEIDLDLFLTMTEQDLADIGVSTLGARRKLSNAITEMKEGEKSGPQMLKPAMSSLANKMMSHSGRF